jgi:hypothetical protein
LAGGFGPLPSTFIYFRYKGVVMAAKKKAMPKKKGMSKMNARHERSESAKEQMMEYGRVKVKKGKK